MTHYVLHVETNDLDNLIEAIAAFERMGIRVECLALETRIRRQARDEWLRRAHGLMKADTPWKRCVQLAGELRTFESRDDTSPERRSELRRCLFEARLCGELPSTPEQIRNIILKQSGPSNVTPGVVE